jgi:AcrR family transcriptional regulator
MTDSVSQQTNYGSDLLHLRSDPRCVSDCSLTVQILQEKPGTKRPTIVRVATSLFARRGIDGTSMRDVADAAGVREAAIYRYFESKEQMSREIFTSWYGWYSRQLRDIVRGVGNTREKVASMTRLELSTAAEQTDAFIYFCENEIRFLRSLPADVPRAHELLIELVKDGQERCEVKGGDATLLADMLGGALCTVATAAIRRRRKEKVDLELIASSCWALIAA